MNTTTSFRQSFAIGAAIALAVVTSAAPMSAQSAQRFGAQVAALATSIRSGGGGKNGFGIEPQLRLNQLASTGDRGMISLGLGAQYTTHPGGGEDFRISGVFLEPRWVPKLSRDPNADDPRFFPYISARLGRLRQSSNLASSSSGTALGAGAGLAIKINNEVNVDAGLQIVRQSFGDAVLGGGNGIISSPNSIPLSFNPFFTYAAKIGVSIGFPRE